MQSLLGESRIPKQSEEEKWRRRKSGGGGVGRGDAPRLGPWSPPHRGVLKGRAREKGQAVHGLVHRLGRLQSTLQQRHKLLFPSRPKLEPHGNAKHPRSKPGEDDRKCGPGLSARAQSPVSARPREDGGCGRGAF